MKEFMYVFRNDKEYSEPTLEQMQRRGKLWQEWIGNIAAQNKLSETGKRMDATGKVVKSDSVVTDGPYVETKEVIVSYMFVYAENLEDAVEIAKGCPIFEEDGSVEVRPVVTND